MFCSKCGKEIMDEAVICPGCGCPTQNYTQQNNKANSPAVINDAPSGGMIALSILFPIVGIILGIVNINKGARKAGTTYLMCGVITWLVSMIILALV